MQRVVEPELLDELPSEDPRARRARADLRRINKLMGHSGLVTRFFHEFDSNFIQKPPLRLVELGAGDGTFLLSLARRWTKEGILGEATLVDRQELVSQKTRQEFENLGWRVLVVKSDVFEWLEKSSISVNLTLCNLFLHHFEGELLKKLVQGIAIQTEMFIGCEPRRSRLALIAGSLLGVIGCNSVTRCDALTSIRAGFAGKELSALWSEPDLWTLTEHSAGLFSHCFIAKRRHG